MRTLCLVFLLCVLPACRTLSEIATDLKTIDQKLEDLNQKKDQVEASKHSQASAHVIAANRTLKADPEPSRFIEAAVPALDVAESALPTPTAEDLLTAMDIQNKLLAGEVEAARAELAKERGRIAEKDQKLVELQTGIQQLAREKAQTLQELEHSAVLIDQENHWWNRINPFHGLWRGLTRLVGWIVVFLIFGLFLRLGSLFFPQLEIIRWLARVVIYPFKLMLSWLPDFFRTVGAVKYEEFQREKEIADRTVGAIQELKDSDKDAYTNSLRPKLLDWMKDRPELAEHIEKKLVELNLK